MSKLSPEAQSLFDAAKDGDGPTADDRTRVRAKLAARLGAGVLVGGAIGSTVAGGTAAAGAKVAGVGALALKLLATVAVVGGLGGGAYAVTRPPASPAAALESAALATRGAETTDRVVQSMAVANADAHAGTQADADTDTDTDTGADADTGAAADAGTATATATATASDGAPASRRRSAGVLPAPQSSSGSSSGSSSDTATATPPTPGAGAPTSIAPARSPLEEETALLGEAQAALRQGRTDAALRALDQHGHEFGAGALRDERIGTRILTLCSAGRVDEARAEAARFLRESPRSPMAARVRASCAGR